MAPQTTLSLASCLMVSLVLIYTANVCANASEISQAPKLVDQVEKLNHQEGTNATFTCSVGSGELNGLTFEWLKDGKRVTTTTGKLRISTLPENFQSILRVIDLKPTDSAVYTCIATNSFGQDKISTRLNVKVQLKWIVEPQDVQVAVGRQLSIPCSAIGLPLPTIEWTKEIGGNQQQSFVIVGSELQFASVGQQDAGHYECRARNGAEEDLVKRVELKVLGPQSLGPGSSSHWQRPLLLGVEAGSKSKATKTTVIAIDGGGAGPGKAHPMPIPWPVVHCHHHHHHLKYIPKPILIHHWVKKKQIAKAAVSSYEPTQEYEHEHEHEHDHLSPADTYSAAGSELAPSSNPSHLYSAHRPSYQRNHHSLPSNHNSFQELNRAHDSHHHHHHRHQQQQHLHQHEPSTLESKNLGFEDPDLSFSLFADSAGLSDQTFAALVNKPALDSRANKALAPKKQYQHQANDFSRRPPQQQQHKRIAVGGGSNNKKPVAAAQRPSLGDADPTDSTKNIALANKTDLVADKPSFAQLQSSLATTLSEQNKQQLANTIQQQQHSGPRFDISQSLAVGDSQNWMVDDLSSANGREQREATKVFEHVSLEQLDRMQTLENMNRQQQLLLLQQQQARTTIPQFASNNQAAATAWAASASQSLPRKMAAATAMIRQPMSIPIVQGHLPQSMLSFTGSPAIGARMASTMSELHTIDLMTRLAAQMAQVEAERLLAKKQQRSSSTLAASSSKDTVSAKDLRGWRQSAAGATRTMANRISSKPSGGPGAWSKSRHRNVLAILGAPLRNLREKRRVSLAPTSSQLFTGPIGLILNSTWSSFAHRHDANGWTPSPPTTPTVTRQTPRTFDQLSSGAQLNRISPPATVRNSRQDGSSASSRHFVAVRNELSAIPSGSTGNSNLISGPVSTPATRQQLDLQSQSDQLFASSSSSADGLKLVEPPPPIAATKTNSSSAIVSVSAAAPAAGAQNATREPDEPVSSGQHGNSSSSKDDRLQQQAKTAKSKSLPMLATQTVPPADKAPEQQLLLSSVAMESKLAPTTTMSPEQEKSFYSNQREHLSNKRRQQEQAISEEQPTLEVDSVINNSSMYNTLSSNVYNSIADPSQPLQIPNMNYSMAADSSGSKSPTTNEQFGLQSHSLEDQRILLAQALFQQQLRAAKQLSSGRQSALNEKPLDPEGRFSSGGGGEMFATNVAAEEQEQQAFQTNQMLPIPASSFLEFPVPPEQWSSDALKSVNELNSLPSTSANEGSQSSDRIPQSSSDGNQLGTSNFEQQQQQHLVQNSGENSLESLAGQQQQEGETEAEQQVPEMPLEFYGNSPQKLAFERLIVRQPQQQQAHQLIPDGNSARTRYEQPSPAPSSQPYYYPRQQQGTRYESPAYGQQQQGQHQQYGVASGHQRQRPTMAEPGDVQYFASAGYTGSGSSPPSTHLRVSRPVFIRNYRLPHSSGSNHVATYVPAFAIASDSGNSPASSAATTVGQQLLYSTASPASEDQSQPGEYSMPTQYLVPSSDSSSAPLLSESGARPLVMMAMVPTTGATGSVPSVSEPVSYGTVISGSVVAPPADASSHAYGASQQFASLPISPSSLAAIGGGGNLVPTLQTATNDLNRVRQFQTALGDSAGNAMLTQANLTAMARLSQQLKNQVKSLQSRLPQMPNIPQVPQMPNLPMPPPGMIQMAGLALPFAMARANRQANRARDRQVNSAANNGGSTSGGAGGRRDQGLMNRVARISNRILARPRVKPGEVAGADSGGSGGRRPIVASGVKKNRLFGVVRAVMDLSLVGGRPPAPLKLTGASSSKGGDKLALAAASTLSATAAQAVASSETSKPKPKVDETTDDGRGTANRGRGSTSRLGHSISSEESGSSSGQGRRSSPS